MQTVSFLSSNLCITLFVFTHLCVFINGIICWLSWETLLIFNFYFFPFFFFLTLFQRHFQELNWDLRQKDFFELFFLLSERSFNLDGVPLPAFVLCETSAELRKLFLELAWLIIINLSQLSWCSKRLCFLLTRGIRSVDSPGTSSFYHVSPHLPSPPLFLRNCLLNRSRFFKPRLQWLSIVLKFSPEQNLY